MRDSPYGGASPRSLIRENLIDSTDGHPPCVIGHGPPLRARREPRRIDASSPYVPDGTWPTLVDRSRTGLDLDVACASPTSSAHSRSTPRLATRSSASPETDLGNDLIKAPDDVLAQLVHEPAYQRGGSRAAPRHPISNHGRGSWKSAAAVSTFSPYRRWVETSPRWITVPKTTGSSCPGLAGHTAGMTAADFAT